MIPLKDNILLHNLLISYKYKDITIEQTIEQLINILNIESKLFTERDFKIYIIPSIIKHYKLNAELWYKKNRKHEIIKYSQMLMYMMDVYKFGGNRSLSAIGRIVRNKDHATVIYAKKTVQGYLDNDVKFKEEFKEFKQYLFKIIIQWT